MACLDLCSGPDTPGHLIGLNRCSVGFRVRLGNSEGVDGGVGSVLTDVGGIASPRKPCSLLLPCADGIP